MAYIVMADERSFYKYVDHDVGQSYTGHDYIGDDCKGHNYRDGMIKDDVGVQAAPI